MERAAARSVQNVLSGPRELALCEEALLDVVNFQFVDGGKGMMSRSDMILHVVNHGTYHRGLVSDMMYQVPAVPKANDLTVYLKDWCTGVS